MDTFQNEHDATHTLNARLDAMEVPLGALRRRIERRAVEHDTSRLASISFWSLPEEKQLQRIVEQEMNRD